MNPTAPFHVLIIDDSAEDRADLRQMLLRGSQRHYRFTEVETGGAGLRAVRENAGALPNCVLLDFNLPDMNALDVLEGLRAGAALPPCPVVVATGSNTISGAELLRAGAQDYIGKDWLSPGSLTRAVENAVERFALVKARDVAQLALGASQARFRGILRQSPAGIVQTDATGCMTLVNERWCEMLGYSEAELLGKSVLDITHSSSLTATAENVARLAAGGPDFQVEKNYCRKDGSVVPAQSNVRALRTPDGTFLGLIAVVVDLSERQRADQQLRERAGQLDLLARSAQRLFECPSLTPEVREEIFGGIGRLIGVESYFHYRANHGERRLYLEASSGLGEEERRVYGSLKFGEMLCGRVAESGKRLIVEDLPRSTQPGSESLRAAGAQSYAGFPLLDSRGELVGTLAFTSAKRTYFREGDVQMIETICAQVALMMERARVEEELREKTHFLQRISEVTPDVLYVLDITDYRFTWVSQQAANRMGYSPEEILAMGADFMPRVMHPDDLARMPAHFAELARAADGQTLEIDYRLRHPDGRWRWFGGRKTPFTRDADGRVRGIIGTSVDITERKRAEEAVARLAAIVESSHDALFGEDLDGIITSWNRGAEQIFGYRAEEIVGTSIMRLIPADRQAAEHEVQRQIVAGGLGGTFETIRLTKEGREFPASVSIAPLKDAAGKVIGTSRVLHDITERKQAEEALRANTALFSTLIAQAPMGTYVLDAQLRMRQINAHALPSFGSVHPLIGRDFQEVVEILWGPEVAGPIIRVFRNTLATGERYISPPFTEQRHDLGIEQTYEWETQRVTLPDGQHGVVCYFHEVTERARATEALRASQERMSLAAEATGVGIWEWNVLTNTIRWDALMFRIYGIAPTPDGFVHYQDWSGAVLPEDLAENEAILQDTVRRAGQSSREFRIRRRSDGECRHIQAVETVRKNAAGQTEWVVGTNLDITERREAEAALRDADRRKDEFLATLAHELRNPLAPVRNAVAFLHAKGPAVPELQWARDVIDRQTLVLARLIDDLMDVSRINQGRLELNREHADLEKLVMAAVETSRPLIDEMGHTLAVTLPSRPVVVDADLVRLPQVFLNLLNNAAKYTDRGGRIELRVELQGSDVVVSVTDTGIGIPADKLSAIFEMFSQVEGALSRSQGGLGIGLHLVKRLVEMHDGRIEVRSDGPGQGSAFVVRLPIVVEQTYPSQASGDGVKATATADLRILVVDDNRDAAESSAVLLEMMGNHVHMAHDGEEAVAAAQEFRPQVILCDIGLPKLNGYEVCRQIRAQAWAEKIILIAVTGWGQDGDRRQSAEAGFDHHMVKPVDPEALMTLLAGLDTVKG